MSYLCLYGFVPGFLQKSRDKQYMGTGELVTSNRLSNLIESDINIHVHIKNDSFRIFLNYLFQQINQLSHSFTVDLVLILFKLNIC